MFYLNKMFLKSIFIIFHKNLKKTLAYLVQAKENLYFFLFFLLLILHSIIILNKMLLKENNLMKDAFYIEFIILLV